MRSPVYHSLIVDFKTNTHKSSPILDSSKGFFPIIGQLIQYHTSNWYRAYQWQKKHPLRQEALSIFNFRYSLSEFLQMPAIQTVCTVTAYNVFSVFVESTISSQEQNVLQELMQNEKQGVELFRKYINKVKSYGGHKGMACFCYVGKSKERVHEFVVELTPSGSLYIYQSYLRRYTLTQALERATPWEADDLLEKLSVVASTKTNKPTIERMKAFEDLFHVKDEIFKKLQFAFIPLEYTPQSILSIS